MGGSSGLVPVSIQNGSQHAIQVRVNTSVVNVPDRTSQLSIGHFAEPDHGPAQAGADRPAAGELGADQGSTVIQLSLTTVHGKPLPLPVTSLTVQSTRYGRAILFLIGAAIGVLVLTSVFRGVRRRMRADTQVAPEDADPPGSVGLAPATRDTRRRHRMTWPMHDAGPTTPDPGPRDPACGSREPVTPEPGPDEPGSRTQARPRRGRHADAGSAAAARRPDAGRRPEPGRDDAAAGARVARSARPAAPLPGLAPRARPARWTRRQAGAGCPGPPSTGRPGPAAAPAADLHPDRGRSAARTPGPATGRPPPPAAAVPVGRAARRPSAPAWSGPAAGMAVGTLVSRGTGFLRTLVLAYAIGTGCLGNAYNNANTLPNTVYYLMLGGIFTSVVVPLLVRAARRDPDRGEAYAQRMFTLGALALLGGHRGGDGPGRPAGRPVRAQHRRLRAQPDGAVGLLLHPADLLLRHELADRGDPEHPRPVRGADVDPGRQQPGRDRRRRPVRGRWSALGKTPSDISAFGVQLLGIGTTLGVVAQTVALFPSLRAAGFRWRPTLGFRRAEVSEMGRMAWLDVGLRDLPVGLRT